MNIFDNKIIVRNTTIIITDYNIGDCTRLENQFRIYDRITHSYYYLGLFYDEEMKLLFLPRGIDIWYIERLFNEKAYIDTKCDPYDNIGNCKLKTRPRDDKQTETLKFMIGVGDYMNNSTSSQLSVNMRTGGGKTFLAIATMCFFEIKSIVITYSVTWLEQWKERITEYTGISKKEILHITGSASINKLLKMEDVSKYKIFLITHSTIKSYATDNGWIAISKFFKHIKVGIKIYDEAHLNFLNMSMIDFFTNTYKTYYLTATPARSSEEENEIYAKYNKNIPAIDLFDEDEDPHTKYIALKYNSHPTVFDITDCRNQYGLDRNKYTEYLVGRPAYYELLRIIMDLALKNDGKCLIYIGTNNAIMITYKWLSIMYPELYGNIGIFTTLVSKEQKEFEKEKKIILSTTKSAGAAVDIKGLKMVVVLNEPFKSHVTAQQSLGRTRDNDTYYIDCIDLGFNQLKKYYYYKRPIYEKYALSCSDLILKDNELSLRSESIIEDRKINHSMPLIVMDLVSFEKDDTI